LLPALFQAAACHLPAVSPSAFPAFVYLKFTQRSAPCHPPFSGALLATPSLCCVFVFSSFFIVTFFWGGGAVNVPRRLC
jgi:hypothetical protein